LTLRRPNRSPCGDPKPFLLINILLLKSYTDYEVPKRRDFMKMISRFLIVLFLPEMFAIMTFFNFLSAL